MGNTNPGYYCTRFKVKGPSNGAAPLNPGHASGSFNANSYPVPIAVYPAVNTWINPAGNPFINNSSGGNSFSLNFFDQWPSGPLLNKWRWVYDCSETWIYGVTITYNALLNNLGVYEDEYIIEITCANNELGTNNRGYMGLLGMGDGSLYCTVFPFAVIQGNSASACAQCLP